MLLAAQKTKIHFRGQEQQSRQRYDVDIFAVMTGEIPGWARTRSGNDRAFER